MAGTLIIGFVSVFWDQTYSLIDYIIKTGTNLSKFSSKTKETGKKLAGVSWTSP
jgi:hypothetical protein